MSEPYWVGLAGGGVIDYVGGWSAATPYRPGDVVRHNGVDYLAVNPSTNQQPPLAAGLGAGYGTALPASPVDGQEYTLVDSVTNPTYQWRFRYNAGSISAYKWEFVGGPPRYAMVVAEESTAAAGGTWVNLATDGPAIVVPRAGDYIASAKSSYANTSQGVRANIGIAVGDTTPGNPVGPVTSLFTLSVQAASTSCEVLALAVAAGAAIKLRYYAGGATNFFSNRSLTVIPVRVS